MASNGRGIVGTAREVVGRSKAVAQLQAQLATLEVKQKLTKLGIGAGLAGGALVVALYAIGFLLAGGAAGLATVLPWWESLLIVGGALLLITAVLIFIALKLFKAGAPPLPTAAIEEARLTAESLRTHA